VRAGFFRIPEIAERIKLRKDRDVEDFEGRARIEVTSWKQSQKG
jgi:hypothetical protein